MTTEQKYHRRLAAKYGNLVVRCIQGRGNIFLRWGRVDTEYRGKNSLYAYAREAAWHAFKAHPELRGEPCSDS